MKNEPIAALVKDGVVLFEDCEPIPACPMGDLTWGSVCIQCNVCGRFEDRQVPTAASVRGDVEIEPHGAGWAYSEERKRMHYYESYSSVALCGYNGLFGGTYEFGEELMYLHRNLLCDRCLAERDK